MKPSEIKKQIEKLQDILAKDKTKWRFKTLKEIKVLEIELKIWEEALAEVEKLIGRVSIKEQKKLDGLIFPMSFSNVTICLQNFEVEFKKGIKEMGK